jgi:endonuclease YncB( thermonuclease family)
MKRKVILWMILTSMFIFWAFSDQIFPPEVIRADVVTIKDGDTLVLDHQTFRLYGMDAPEYHQSCKDAHGLDWPCGKAARLQLATFVASGSIACTPRAQDIYGRKVATCSSATVPDIGEAMVQAGLAISPAERGSAVYADAEGDARASHRGIWQGAFDVPSVWRAAHPRVGGVPDSVRP